MRLLGATVVPVSSGTKTLKDATNEALRDWVTNVPTTHYIIGSVVGPDPFPRMVRDFQSVIGREARAQVLERIGALPHSVVACVGGGSNAIGIFGFLHDDAVELVGVRGGRRGVASRRHSATLSAGTPGVLHGSMSYLLQGSRRPGVAGRSISAEASTIRVSDPYNWLRDQGRVQYHAVDDGEALAAFQLMARLEGIIPALETAHAIAWITRSRGRWSRDQTVLLCLSGRGDKDVAHVAAAIGTPA